MLTHVPEAHKSPQTPGYKDSDPDYHLTRAATLFSAACAVSETLGPMLVLSNSDSVVTFGIIFICCMHLYIISTLIVDAGASSKTSCKLVRACAAMGDIEVFTWNFVDALLYIFLFGCYGPAVGGVEQRAIPDMSVIPLTDKNSESQPGHLARRPHGLAMARRS